MKTPLLAAATALLLLGTAGAASANPGHGQDHKAGSYAKGQSDGKGHSDERSRHDRDCDGIVNGRDHQDKRNLKDKDCDGIANRFDHQDGRVHEARRSFAGPSYREPRNFRYARYGAGATLPRSYWGSDYYVDYQPYQLPPPRDGYRWNRVGNDVYMVDVRTGLISEAIYSLFR